MAKFSKKMMGNEVGAASVYAKPHTMSGKEVKASTNPGKGANGSDAATVNMSAGNIYKREEAGPKTSGITVRGGKAQTKGKMARGPMA
jgi:hypothetical protein